MTRPVQSYLAPSTTVVMAAQHGEHISPVKKILTVIFLTFLIGMRRGQLRKKDTASIMKIGAMDGQKLTALGRLKHENAEAVIARDGHVVVYLGDDERGDCLYKFVSDGIFSDGGDNSRLLHEGRFLSQNSMMMAPARMGCCQSFQSRSLCMPYQQ